MFGCDSVYTVITTLQICDDGNSCTIDTCGSLSGNPGCVYVDTCSHPCDTLVCDDGDACTIDDCDPLSGCIHTPLDCDDGDACTEDSCTNGQCVNTPVACDDLDACTTDNCDPLSGCIYTPLACDDGDSCTTDGCDPLTGCTHTPIVPCGVGIFDVSPISDNIKVYPIPAHDVFTVEGTNVVIKKIRMSDVFGKQVFDSGQINAARYSMEIQNQPPGVYVLRVETDKGEGVKKLLIQE